MKWLFWVTAFFIRLILIITGWIFPIHIGYDTPRTNGLNLWERYVENCWRNPTPYLRGIFKQPIPEVKPNPDDKARLPGWPEGVAAIRKMEEGPYIEYWSLQKWRDRYWEFRIGWKFVDGDDTFWPTLQFGPRK